MILADQVRKRFDELFDQGQIMRRKVALKDGYLTRTVIGSVGQPVYNT